MCLLTVKLCADGSQSNGLTQVICSQSLTEIKGLSDAKIEKMVEAARKCVPHHGWQTAAAVEKQVSTLVTTSFFCTARLS